jgi:hypothetical protein
MTPGGSSTPWNRLDVTVWVAGMVAALALWSWTWWQAAGTPVLTHQLPWVSGALGALLFAAAMHAGWLLRGRRRIGLRRAALLHDDAGAGAAVTETVVPFAAFELVAAAGLRRYHRAGCPLARGAAFTTAERPVHESAGRLPCGVCRP